MLLQCTVAAKKAGGLREWLPTAISAALKLRGTASHCSVAIFGGFHISIHDRVRRAYRRFAHRRDRWRHGPGCAWGGSATLWESPGAAPPVSLPLVELSTACIHTVSVHADRWWRRHAHAMSVDGVRAEITERGGTSSTNCLVSLVDIRRTCVPAQRQTSHRSRRHLRELG